MADAFFVGGGERGGEERNKKMTEDEKILKLYEWHRADRDFQLTQFWENSKYIWGFLAVCVAGYGTLLLNVLSKEEGKDVIPFDVANLVMFLISLLGLIAAFMWLFMSKGCKAWYEVHENAIWTMNKENPLNLPGKFLIENFFLLKHQEKKCRIMDSDAVSPSKINIGIAWIVICLWTIAFIFHSILLCRQVDINTILEVFKNFSIKISITAILVIFILAILFKSFIKSSTLSGDKYRLLEDLKKNPVSFEKDYLYYVHLDKLDITCLDEYDNETTLKVPISIVEYNSFGDLAVLKDQLLDKIRKLIDEKKYNLIANDSQMGVEGKEITYIIKNNKSSNCMKTIIKIALALIVIVGVWACSGGGNSSSDGTPSSVATDYSGKPTRDSLVSLINHYGKINVLEKTFNQSIPIIYDTSSFVKWFGRNLPSIKANLLNRRLEVPYVVYVKVGFDIGEIANSVRELDENKFTIAQPRPIITISGIEVLWTQELRDIGYLRSNIDDKEFSEQWREAGIPEKIKRTLEKDRKDEFIDATIAQAKGTILGLVRGQYRDIEIQFDDVNQVPKYEEIPLPKIEEK